MDPDRQCLVLLFSCIQVSVSWQVLRMGLLYKAATGRTTWFRFASKGPFPTKGSLTNSPLFGKTAVPWQSVFPWDCGQTGSTVFYTERKMNGNGWLIFNWHTGIKRTFQRIFTCQFLLYRFMEYQDLRLRVWCALRFFYTGFARKRDQKLFECQVTPFPFLDLWFRVSCTFKNEPDMDTKIQVRVRFW